MQVCQQTPKAQNKTIKQKLKEKLVIAVIDTCINPWTVVIKFSENIVMTYSTTARKLPQTSGNFLGMINSPIKKMQDLII